MQNYKKIAFYFSFRLFCVKLSFMVQTQTYLNVADNTGAKKLMCINILGSNSKSAGIGDIIIGVVKLSYLCI